MIRIGKMTDYALLITNQLVKSGGKLNTTEQLAEETGLPFATVRKLLKQLVDSNVVESFRGTRGGYKLLKSAAAINVAEVIAAIEGPIALTECSLNGECRRGYNCELIENWKNLNASVVELFRRVSLADMAQSPIDKPSLRAGVIEMPLAGKMFEQ